MLIHASKRGLASYALLSALMLRVLPAAAEGDGWKEDEAALANAPPSEEPVPAPRDRLDPIRAASVVLDLGVHTGLAWTTLSDWEGTIADFVSSGVDLSLGIGTFVSAHWKSGYEVTGGLRHVLQPRDVPLQPAREGLESTRIQGNTWYLLPLGGYVEFYPEAHGGLSFGLHLGFGAFWPAPYLRSRDIDMSLGAALDAGYDVITDEVSWGFRLGCGGLVFSASDFINSTTMGSKEITVAGRLSAF